MKISALVCALSFPLVACGGGDSHDGAKAFALPSKQVTIAMVGDSTMRGMMYPNGLDVNLGVQSVYNPPIEVQAVLRAQYANQVNTINYGSEGDTIDRFVNGGMYRFPWNVTGFLAIDNSKIVVLNYAINDANIGESTATFTSDLTTIKNALTGASRTMVLVEPNPVCDNATHATNLDAMVAAERSWASSNGVTLIAQYDYVKSLSNWQTTYFIADCVHPTDALYKIMSDRTAAALAPIVAGFL
jgi:acyl-CoA thioesterase-1